ncbi:hypothetical protein [Thermogutta sp.]
MFGAAARRAEYEQKEKALTLNKEDLDAIVQDLLEMAVVQWNKKEGRGTDTAKERCRERDENASRGSSGNRR